MVKVIVENKNGQVCTVYSTDRNIDVEVVDWDDAAYDEEYREECEDLKNKANKMHVVYGG